MTECLLGALIMLVGVIVGHATGKPWLDRYLNRIKPTQKQIEEK